MKILTYYVNIELARNKKVLIKNNPKIEIKINLETEGNNFTQK